MPGHDHVVAGALSGPPFADTELFDCADEHVLSELGKWVAIVAPHVRVPDMVDSARASLKAGRKLCAVRCTHCAGLHLD